MQEELFKFVSATFGISTAVALAVILLALWLTHYITKKVTEIRCENEAITTDHKAHTERISTLNEDVGYCKTSLKTTEKISGDLDEIRRDLSYLKGTIDIIRSGGNPLMASHSPVKLTEDGEKVAEELRARQIVEDNWENIAVQLDPVENSSPYDIQQFCLESVSVEPEKYVNDKSLIAIKDYAFSKGQPLQLYLRVIGLIIRDKYLALLDIPLSRIDETAPKQ